MLLFFNFKLSTIFNNLKNIRFETTGIRPEHLRDAMPLKQVQKKIQEILYNGGEKARVLVGHGVEDDLKRLQIGYPIIR